MSSEVVPLTAESPSGLAYENVSPKRNRVGRTRVGKRSLNLRRTARSVIAFRFPVSNGQPLDSLLHSRLTLPLVRQIKRPRVIDLSFVGLVPNLEPFQGVRGDISRRKELTPAETTQVFLATGTTEIVVQDALIATVAASLQQSDWHSDGNGNSIAIKVTRTDSRKGSLRIAGLGNRRSNALPTFDLCRGESCRLRLACLGDSNTHSDWMTLWKIVSWCDRLHGRHFAPTIHARNYGTSGATVIKSPKTDANEQFDLMIANGYTPDVVVAAYGSNDVIFFAATPEEIVTQYLDLQLRAQQIGARFLVALTPGLHGALAVHNPTIAKLNVLITVTFAPENVADFYITNHDCFIDNVHMNNLGHEIRCDAVLDRLF